VRGLDAGWCKGFKSDDVAHQHRSLHLSRYHSDFFFKNMSGTLKAAQDRLTAVSQSLTGRLASNAYTFPAFDDLPKVDGMPQGNLWGFYDKDGKKDEVGGMYQTFSSHTHTHTHTHDYMPTHYSQLSTS
jgi:hypothetical protein